MQIRVRVHALCAGLRVGDRRGHAPFSASACASQKLIPISRYSAVAAARCSRAWPALARAPVEPAEAEVAVGDECAHTARLGERQRLAVVVFTRPGVEPVGMGGDVAEEM